MITHTASPDEHRAECVLSELLRVRIGRHKHRHLKLPGTVFVHHGLRLHAAVQMLQKEGYVLSGLTLSFRHETTKSEGTS